MSPVLLLRFDVSNEFPHYLGLSQFFFSTHVCICACEHEMNSGECSFDVSVL